MRTVIWNRGAKAELWKDQQHGYYIRFQVDIGIWPVAPGHEVIVRWTRDCWKTFDDWGASWISNIPNPYGGWDEAWSAIIKTDDSADILFWYAVFVRIKNDKGNVIEEIWDNNGGWNYELHYQAK